VVRWPVEFVAEIDRVRGDVPRTVWVRRAVEAALGADEGVVGPLSDEALRGIEGVRGEPKRFVDPRAEIMRERQERLNRR